MSSITIQLPTMEAEQSIEITVKINGSKQKYNYKVEIYPWNKCKKEEIKAQCLKHMIEEYDPSWQLVHIGAEGQKEIPIMFKQKGQSN